jgi:hypothetical protein
VNSDRCTQCKGHNAWTDQNSAETAALVQEVANTSSSNSAKWVIDPWAPFHLSPNKNSFESVSSVQGNVVLSDKAQVE